jgi:cysteine synthase A
MGRIYSDITWTIGNTPLVRLNKVTKSLHSDVLAKVESFNPMGSVKDRIGLAIIEEAEREGKIKKGTTIISVEYPASLLRG